MGRGRAKAKQAKVARQLKYSGADTDLEALRKELAGGSNMSASAVGVESTFSDDELDDEYDEYDDDEGSEGDDDPEDDRSFGAGSRR